MEFLTKSIITLLVIAILLLICGGLSQIFGIGYFESATAFFIGWVAIDIYEGLGE
jgi:uncharacterized membrane protein YjjP (DUF1212 family)